MMMKLSVTKSCEI